MILDFDRFKGIGVLCFLLVSQVLAQEGPTLPKTLKYDLDIVVDYDQLKLFGRCDLTVKNAGDEQLKVIPIIVYRLLTIRAVKDENGQLLPFSQEIVAFKDETRMQVNHVRVTPSRPIQPGETLTLHVAYDGFLHGYQEVMGYVRDTINREYTVLRSDCLAFPQIGVPSWKTNRATGFQSFEYEASVTVPDSLVVANGGRLIAKESEDGKTTFTYRNLVPCWRIDLAISNYRLLNDPKNNFTIFHFPGDEVGAENLRSCMTKVMNLYSDWFGPLKGNKGLTVIEIPDGYGSQTDVTTILQVASAFRSQDSHYRFYHELSHLWNVKSNDTFPPRFEGEGLAMFLQHLVQEKLERKTGAVKKSAERIANRFLDQCKGHPEQLDVPMIAYGEHGLTDLSYTKGMVFFFLLFELLGEESFLKTMGDFYQTYVDQGATTREFVNFVKAQSELELGLLFDEWVFGATSSHLINDGIDVSALVDRYRH